MLRSIPVSDLVNWARLASIALAYLKQGSLPPVSVVGVYGYMSVVLAPFLWLWTILPINHPPLSDGNYLYSNSTPAFFLNLLLKAPLFIADIAAGILVMKLVKMMSGSETKSRLAFLVWFANPFNIILINILGSVDVIPASILLFAIYLATTKRNFSSGVWLSIGGLLRIFPFLTFPFLLSSFRDKKLRSIAQLSLGFLTPIVIAIIALQVFRGGTLQTVTLIPTHQTWLLDFLGTGLAGENVKSAVVVVVLQLLVCMRFWKNPNCLHAVASSLLALFISSLAYGSDPNHFVWVTPLLTISFAINSKEVWFFLLTFVSATSILFEGGLPLVGKFVWGIFQGAMAIYLLKLNQENICKNPADSRAFSLRT